MTPINRTHPTSDGPIRVWVHKTPDGWMAPFQGPQLDGGRVLKELKAANAYAERSFAEMCADSGRRRKGFRDERENDSGVKANGIPG